MANLEGVLVGVSESVGFSAKGVVKSKLVVSEYVGGNEARVVLEIEADDGTVGIVGNFAKVVEKNRITFGLTIKLDGTTYYQMATVGRKSAGYPWAFTLGPLVDNQSAVTSIDGAYRLNDTLWVAHNNDGSVNRTDDAANYTTATYITQKINGSRSNPLAATRRKALVMAGVATAPLTTGQSVSLYYRTDGTSAWTLIRTYAYGDDAARTPALSPANMGFEAGKADTDGDGTPDADFINFKEVQFKVTSAAGAEVTGIPYAWKFADADTIP
jgi:hypothetical protein